MENFGTKSPEPHSAPQMARGVTSALSGIDHRPTLEIAVLSQLWGPIFRRQIEPDFALVALVDVTSMIRRLP